VKSKATASGQGGRGSALESATTSATIVRHLSASCIPAVTAPPKRRPRPTHHETGDLARRDFHSEAEDFPPPVGPRFPGLRCAHLRMETTPRPLLKLLPRSCELSGEQLLVGEGGPVLRGKNLVRGRA
jgi:hypothetical protein